MLSQLQSKVLLPLYSGMNHLGLLKIPIVQRQFQYFYFLYKRHLEDPYAKLASKHPEYFLNGHVLDIGANIGYTASVFMEAVSPDYKVFAFEPDEKNFKALETQIRALDAEEKIVPVRTAVGNEVGHTFLWVNERHHADHRIVTTGFSQTQNGRKVEVPLVSLDWWTESEKIFPVSFIKVDVQGYEPSVCLGMVETLTKNPDAIVAIEYCPKDMTELGFSPEDFLEFFAHRGYLGYLLEKNGDLHELTTSLLEKSLQRKYYLDLIFKRN